MSAAVKEVVFQKYDSMNSREETDDLLDRYVKGRLTETELVIIKQLMHSDADFRVRAERHQQMYDALALVGQRRQLKKVLEEVDSEMAPAIRVNTVSKSRMIWPTIAIAASVSLISVVATYLYTNNREQSQYVEFNRELKKVEQSQQKILKEIDASKKKIAPAPGKYAGSAFLISSKGYAATSYHVVKEADSIWFENERFGALKAKVVYNDAANDISILKIDSLNVTSLPYTIVRAPASIAEGVYTLGYPRDEVVFGEGSISAMTGYRENANAYQISVPVNPGNSGGPLVNHKGNVVGMISGSQTQVTGTAFAIKSAVILDVLAMPAIDSLHGSIPLSKSSQLGNKNRVQQVDRWKDFVFMVRVFKN
jgi:serine protease Do